MALFTASPPPHGDSAPARAEVFGTDGLMLPSSLVVMRAASRCKASKPRRDKSVLT